MDTGLYVALSSQMSVDKRLSTVAHNVANSNTIGFRATKVRFDEVLDNVSTKATSFVSEGSSYVSPQSGGIIETGGTLDFAIQGDVWFAVQTPAGTVVTRDGRFKMQPTGEVVSLDGHPVLDVGGTPIQLNPAGDDLSVGRDGFLVQDGVQVGAIGLFEYTPTANFRRHGGSGIIAENPPQPAVDRNDIGVVQGSLEQSNVDPVAEMSKLISIHRAFDNVAAMIRDSESSLEEAIRTLGHSR